MPELPTTSPPSAGTNLPNVLESLEWKASEVQRLQWKLSSVQICKRFAKLLVPLLELEQKSRQGFVDNLIATGRSTKARGTLLSLFSGNRLWKVGDLEGLLEYTGWSVAEVEKIIIAALNAPPDEDERKPDDYPFTESRDQPVALARVESPVSAESSLASTLEAAEPANQKYREMAEKLVDMINLTMEFNGAKLPPEEDVRRLTMALSVLHGNPR